MSAPTQLIRMGRARVMSYIAVRKPDLSGYLVKIYPEPRGYGEEGELRDAELMNQFLEARIREYPDQYLWVHRRFKSRPEGQNDFYGIKRARNFQNRDTDKQELE